MYTSTTMHQSDADLIYKHCKNTQNYTASYQDKYDLVTNHIFSKFFFFWDTCRKEERVEGDKLPPSCSISLTLLRKSSGVRERPYGVPVPIPP